MRIAMQLRALLLLELAYSAAAPSLADAQADSLKVDETRSAAYAAVLQQARDVVIETWGRQETWDSLCGSQSSDHRITLSLDPRLRVAGNPLLATRFLTKLHKDTVTAFITRGYIESSCVPASDALCVDSLATMNVSLTTVRQSDREDSTSVSLAIYRSHFCPHDHEAFAAEVEFVLRRTGSQWVVQKHRLLWIT